MWIDKFKFEKGNGICKFICNRILYKLLLPSNIFKIILWLYRPVNLEKFNPVAIPEHLYLNLAINLEKKKKEKIFYVKIEKRNFMRTVIILLYLRRT